MKKKRGRGQPPKATRNRAILQLVAEGQKQAEVARMFQISRARVWQIVQRGY